MDTTPLGFKKPLGPDSADLRVYIGDNMDLIDRFLTNKETKIYKQPTTPTSPVANDLWINTASEPFSLSIYNGSTWSLIAGGSSFTEDSTHRFTTDTEKTAWNAKADAATTTSALNSKVDVVTGKGLSTNDYTTAEKDKLFNLSNYANKTVLDALSDSAGSLFYNGVPIASGGSVILEPDYVVKDAWNTTGTRTLPTGDNYKFYINNTGNADLTFTINNVTFTVKTTEEFEDIFDPFTQVIVTATSTFDANVSGLKSGSSLPIYSVKDYFSGSANTTRSFSGPVYGIVISNDGLTALTYSVNGLTLTVDAGDVIERFFDALTQVTINSTVAYRTYIKSGLNAVVTGSTVADTTAPINVTNLTASSVTSTTLTLTWTASISSDVASYDVYNGSTFLGNTATTNFNVTGLTEKTQYTFTVKAKDASTNVAAGTPYTVTTADITAPANATNPTATNVTQTTLKLNWTASASSDVASYDVYSGTTFLGNATTSSYNVTGLTAGTSYTFNVKAKDASNNAASGVMVSTVTIPSDVTNLTTSNLTSTSLTVNWFASTGATSYDVYNGASLLGNTATSSYNVSGLTANTQYTFKVIARNSSGSSTGVTTIATTSSTTVNPVTSLSAGTATINSIPVTWVGSSSTVTNQEITFSTDGANFSAPITLASGVTAYTVTGLSAGITYTIRVVAVDASSNRSVPTTVQKATAAAVNYTVSATPPAGTYGSTQNVVLSCAPTGATIYYTINGSTPTTSNTVYSTPISISATQTLKFFAQDSVGNLTAVQTANYTIDTIAPNPAISPVAGTPTSSTIPITWTLSPSVDVANYEIAHSTDNFVNNIVIDSAVVNASSTSYTVTGLTASTPYTVRVVAIDIAGNRSAAVTTTATTAASVLVSDDFNRADASTLGTTTIGGKTWVNSGTGGNLQIIGNQVGTTTTLTTNGYSYFDSTKNDNVEISVDFTVPSTFTSATMAGITFRYKSASTGLYAFGLKSDTTIGIYAIGVSGMTIPTAKTVTSLVGGTHSLKVKLQGQLVECYLDGVLQYSFNDMYHYTSSTHGLVMYNATVPRFDNFRIAEFADVTAPIVLSSPAEGSYPSARNVTLSTVSIESAEIYYTINGSTPTTSSTLYNAAIPINSTTTLKYISKDSKGNIGSVQQAVYTITPVTAGTVVFADTFNRADAADLGTSSSGTAWTAAHATARLGITANQLGWVTGNSAVNVIHFVDAGYSSGIELSVDIAAASASDQCGIVLRYVDNTDYLKLMCLGNGATHQMTLTRTAVAASTVISTVTQSTIARPYKLRAILEGTRIKGYFDSTLVMDIDIAENAAKTKHGVVVNNGVNARMDNYEIKTI